MTSSNSVNTEQWRNNYAVFVDSRLADVFRKLVLKQSLFNELVTDKNKKILDLGCGSGAFLRYLASRGFRNLYGAEPDVELAKRIPSGVAIEVRNCRAENLAFEDCTFDVVHIYKVLHHLKGLSSYSACCDEIYRVLKPGGLVFIMEPGGPWMLRMRAVGVKFLGVVSETFRALSEARDEETDLHCFFAENHHLIKDYCKNEKGFKVMVDKYSLSIWLFTFQKPK
jgi:2-polyprenyl-3-methyl-5-hydroxy-6-metoxy-1,4-benzoquinol methylase